MNFNNTKSEIKKTFWRKLKKQKQQKIYNLKNLFKSTRVNYNVLPFFLKIQSVGINKSTISNLVLIEAGTLTVFNFWFKKYIFKKY